jgi:hypothetical protein
MHSDVWMYRETGQLGTNIETANLDGYEVEALDGSIGKIDKASQQARSGYIVVDTGPWIFGKKVMLPAGVIRAVDDQAETVFVNRTKEQIKNAPEFDESLIEDQSYRGKLGTYYGQGGPGYRDWDDTV